MRLPCPVEAIFDPQKRLQLTLPFNPKTDLGLRNNETGVYRLEINCNGRKFYYPTTADVAHFTYEPWYRNISPWVLIPVWFIVMSILLLILYLFKPRYLLLMLAKIHYSDVSGNLKLPLFSISMADCIPALSLWLLPWLAARPRVLNAWLLPYSEQWQKNGFSNEETVIRCQNYVSLPCRLSGQAGEEYTVDNPSAALLDDPTIKHARWLQIEAPGGAGKTMLMIQLARWMQQTEHRQKIVRFPLLIEQDFSNDIASELLNYIQMRLYATIDISVPFQIIKLLLANGHIVPLFDRLSERSEQTISAIEQLSGHLRIRLIVVTARRKLTVKGGHSISLYPLSLEYDVISSFISRLLRLYNVENYDAFQLVPSLMKSLDKIIKLSDQSIHAAITPLLVKTFVDSAVDSTKGSISLTIAPESIPAVYSAYLTRLNPDIQHAPLYVPSEDLLKASRILALSVLKTDFVPRDIDYDEACKKLQAIDFSVKNHGDIIQRLIDNGVLVKNPFMSRYNLAFALDPLAEYLAADELLHDIFASPDKSQSYQQLKETVEAAGEPAKGFLVALEVTWHTLLHRGINDGQHGF